MSGRGGGMLDAAAAATAARAARCRAPRAHAAVAVADQNPTPRAIPAAASTITATSIACTWPIRAYARARASVGQHPPPRGHPPADEARHRHELEHEDQRERTHLQMKERRMQIIVAALLEAAERANDARHDQHERGHAPDRVGLEHIGQIGGLPRAGDALERTVARGDRREREAEPEQMNGGEQPSDGQHRSSLCRRSERGGAGRPAGVMRSA